APFSWTGFYIGANLGGSWAENDVSWHNEVSGTTKPLQASGVIGGGQVGYNLQSGAWVLGIEADLAARDLSASYVNSVPNHRLVETDKQGWVGTVRARLGYTAGSWLLYATGGFAYGEVEHLSSLGNQHPGARQDTSDSRTATGWTVGGGVEWA